MIPLLRSCACACACARVCVGSLSASWTLVRWFACTFARLLAWRAFSCRMPSRSPSPHTCVLHTNCHTRHTTASCFCQPPPPPASELLAPNTSFTSPPFFFFSLSLISHLCLQLPKTGVAAANTSDLKRTLGASFTIKRVAALKSVWVSAHTHTYTHTLFTCHDQHWDAAPPPTADAAQTSEQLLVCNGSALRSCCAPFDTITTSRR